MSYSDYLRKLQFGNVSESVDALKEHQLSSLTNPLDKSVLGLDQDVTSLTGKISAQNATDTDVTTGLNSLGGTVEGIATMKKLYSKFKDFKDKASDLKDKLTGKKKEGEEEGEEGEEGGEGEGGDFLSGIKDQVSGIKGQVTDQVSGIKDQVSGIKGQVTDQVSELKQRVSGDGGETKSDTPDGDNPDEFAYSSDNPGVPQRGGGDIEMEEMNADDDLVDGPSELNEVTSTDLAPTTTEIPSTELGSGTITNTEPSGSGEADVQLQTFSSNQEPYSPDTLSDVGNSPSTMQSEAPTIAESDPEVGRSLASALGDVKGQLGSAEDTASSLTSKLGGVGADAADAAAEAGADATEIGLESAGGIADATGIGAIVGIGLQIAGAAVAIGSTVADSTSNPNSDESQLDADEEKEDSLKTQELTDQAAVAAEQFVGASITPDMSSLTLQNVTSGSF